MRSIKIVTVLLILLLSIPVIAEEKESAETDWNFLLGVGVSYMPSFYGSKYNQLLTVPVIMIDYRERLFLSMDGLRFSLVKTGWLTMGPIVRYDFGRDEKGSELLKYFRVYGESQPDLQGIGNVDDSVMTGGFAEVRFKSIALNVSSLKAVNGHRGLTGKAGFKYNGFIPVPWLPLIWSADIHTVFADSVFNKAYFGIDEVQSKNSGLEMYDPGGGFISYGAGLFLMHPCGRLISITAFGAYDRLTGEIRNSPLIMVYGNGNQFSGGIMINYRFSY